MTTTFLPNDHMVQTTCSVKREDRDADPEIEERGREYIVMVKRDSNGTTLRTAIYRPRNLSVKELENFKARDDTKVYRTTHTSLVQKISGMNRANIARFMEKDE
jgi:hypothetical protein